MKSIKCPRCGLVSMSSGPTCKICGGSLEANRSPRAQSEQSDPELIKSIKTKQAIIYGLGFTGTLALSIVAAVNTDDATRMMVWFGGIILIGIMSTWVVASIVESRMLGGRKDFVYNISATQKASVLAASLACAVIVFNSDYGFIISPMIVVIFNGALYLYERQMRSKRRAAGS